MIAGTLAVVMQPFDMAIGHHDSLPWSLFHKLEIVREMLAPTKLAAALWAISFLVFVAVWCLWGIFRVRTLLSRMRAEDASLWQEFGCPQAWDDLGKASNWATFRRLRVDRAFARQFNQPLVAEIRGLQRGITAGLVFMALFGLLVMYLAWPHQ